MSPLTAPSTPIVIVLFGGTGDLAKRMVIPAFYTLFLQKLLPSEFMLVGNGRGDVSHEDFRGHVHDVLTEFGTKPEGKDWEEFADRLRFAGGGFDSDQSGEPARRHRRSPEAARRQLRAGALLRGAAGRVRRPDRRARRARAGRRRQGRLREAVRHVPGELPRTRQGRAQGAERGSGLPDRPFPGQGGHPGPAHPAVREQPVRQRLELPSTSRRSRSTPRRNSTSTTGRCSTTPPARCSTC